VDLGLKGRRALVTAASKGLGRGCAQALAAEDARVFIAARGSDDLARTAGEIGAAGFLAADVGREGVPESLVQAAVETLGGLDILVINAGGPPPGTFESTPLEAWQTGFQLTLMSAVRLAKAALPHLKASDQARIVAITSTSVREPIGSILLSNAFRSAVVAMLKTMSIEYAPLGITVNNLAPGRFRTDRILQTSQAAAERAGISVEEAVARSEREIPMGRMGDPAEFGAVCAFLCGRQAGYLTGQTIAVDGALTRGVH
jgi:3-oxoacyl-[acyl-carrier protein] reductase